ncbi:glycosyltransferase [Altererythrobacter arenosus]|uniref:Glycosyltransferase n=1 Tax=Altererythrobacter arenosus TaxID=3032592 RepID=A0ABY8FRE7_9SPHN|nr:glycosyltransferase [Altererythrobacter sp. CAU 1644]WFL75976.1 glycosyltransferase [Altererythrobacter sp. CAU 1644]
MILVTVGTQLGFDRLIRAMDAIQPGIGIEFVAQIGRGRFIPRRMDWAKTYSPADFEALTRRAALIVSHAGIGSVLAARRLGKPIVLLPRRATLREHRSDHQLATARQLADRKGIFVAIDERELPGAIARGLACGEVEHGHPPELLRLQAAVSGFIGFGELR